MSLVSSPDDVFINCPFDAEYDPLFKAIVFTVFACGFRPRSAKELDDAGDTRFDKIMRIIGECRYGIHDISRTELDPVFGLPRFNMPFELGLFLAAKQFGGDDHSKKRVLVFDTEPYRYQRFLSDLNGMDITPHGGDQILLARGVRNWLANASRRRLITDLAIAELLNRFRAELPQLAAEKGYDANDIPYVDYEYLVTDWLLA
ncbi:hypothetical protein [Novosphingobium sp.]|uniref:hypothetical protein n=1 Tax=Novosphingobium sp. TaxID=1874826 RepID=UPI0022C28FCF|nr:hypothetical protein [Novosphingobium sp.]MCZ8017603.1 hypothetical protein [Novosphingobium sp.]MCZ8033873.1 hypothetical protein [Novosphingobium sp.]MCZ8051229.1 hypothetical protein [Novosphingobium sp.]MCZ8059575.1 hypothetical protein [Novosphingobium sp.]MCZ8231413.1 hypothetical protein [Novosphingobium sp.]